MTSKSKYVRSPLKWAGSKFNVLERIKAAGIRKGDQLTEPFVGGGSVFLNLEFDHYFLVDLNPDLINFYQCVQEDVTQYIDAVEGYFTKETNTEIFYYQSRAIFNRTDDKWLKAALFLYLNRHGYNGLCRYGIKTGYNVPYGKYKSPYFPKNELHHLAEVSQRANFKCGDFELAFSEAQPTDKLYCDPPYSEQTKTSNFTQYAGVRFTHEDHIRLANKAVEAKGRGVLTLISNNDVAKARELYSDADKIWSLKARKSISCTSLNRKETAEIIAVYGA